MTGRLRIDLRRDVMRRIGILFALTWVLCGCSAVITDPNAGSINDITVGADEFGAPTIEYPDGLEYAHVETRVLWSGKGERLNPGDRILLDMYAVSLETGVVLTNTFTDLPNAYLLIPELVGQELYDILVRERVGSRILHISPPVEGYEGQGSVALVVDVLPARAMGEVLPHEEGLPVVLLEPDGTPSIIVDDMTTPIETQSVVLIEGPGAQIQEGSLIKVNYLGVSLDTGEIFESSWDDGEGPMSAQMGSGQLPAGWDQGLIDKTEGSQVLLVIPPQYAYGEDTLIFVIDILAVRDPV